MALCFGLSAAPQVFMRVMAPVSEFSTVLDSASALSARLANSGVLPRVGSSFSEDGPPVVQFSRNSCQLREVSACVASEDFSSSESYWTLSVSGLLQPRNESTSFSQLAPCFYHEWINLQILARVDEDAIFSDSAHSGGAAADAVVPVCPSSGLGPLRFRSSCGGLRRSARIFSGGWTTSGSSSCLPSSTSGPTLTMSVGLSSQSFSGFRVDPEPGSVSAASEKVAGVNRPVRNLTISPLLTLF